MPPKRVQPPQRAVAGNIRVSELEGLEYARDMIESIRKIVERHGHVVLAKLLEVAARETQSLINALR